jgi:aconitate hydratase
MVFDLELIKKVYAAMPEKVAEARKLVGRPLH